jgi:hypothetical protein
VEGLMYLAPACTLWLFVGSLLTEAKGMMDAQIWQMVAKHPIMFLAAAIMGFAVNYLSYIVIYVASSLTLKVLGTVKNIVVVCLGVALLGEIVTPLQKLGYGVSLAAFTWYQHIKLLHIAANDRLPKVSGEKK